MTHDEKTDRFGVRYTELLAPVIKAVQELFALMKGQESRLAALQSENQKMKRESEAQAKQINALTKWICAKDKTAPVCK